MTRRLLRSGAIICAVIVTTVMPASVDQREMPAVVVLGRDGSIAKVPLGRASTFSLRFRHSIYKRPAVETFEVDQRGGFELVRVSSPDEETLDYYGVEGSRSSKGQWRRLSLGEPPRFTRLSLIATPTGRRTLVVGDRRVPLYDGLEAAHVTICIGPRLGCS